MFLFVIVVFSRFDSAVVSASIIAMIFMNLGKSTGDNFSAYSVFNKGYAYLLGDSRPEMVDRQLRQGTGPALGSNSGDSLGSVGGVDIPSRFINRPCPCGSGLKAKKCCALRTKNRGHHSKPSHSPAEDTQEYDFTGFEVVG